MKAKIIGKKVNSWVDQRTGEARVSRVLHVEYMPTVQPAGVEGNETDRISVKFDITNIKVGGIYDLEITKNNYQGNRYTTIESYSEVKA